MTADTPSLMPCCRCERCMAGLTNEEAHDESHAFERTRAPGWAKRASNSVENGWAGASYLQSKLVDDPPPHARRPRVRYELVVESESVPTPG